jgi:hypothetical protein
MHELIHHSLPDGTAYPREHCHIYAVFRSGRGCQIDHEVFWRKDGRAFAVDYTSFLVYEQDLMTGAVVTFIDATSRKRLEKAAFAGMRSQKRTIDGRSKPMASNRVEELLRTKLGIPCSRVL